MKHGVYVDFYLKLRWPHQSGSGSKIKKGPKMSSLFSVFKV